MENKDWIIQCTAYIEKHLKETLSVRLIADQSGYSPWHFSRCFKVNTGLSPMEYVKQRRLFAAAQEIRKGQKILDVAMDYGWESHSGFTKAFLGLFGYSPVILRACYIRDVSVKGDQERMELYLKTMELYKEPEELFQVLCLILEENQMKYDRKDLRRIYDIVHFFHKGQKRYSGEDYIIHPLNVAVILADMGAEEEVVEAGLLHDVSENVIREKLTGKNKDQEILSVLTAYWKYKASGHWENERGTLVALADRLHNMRTIEFTDQETWKKRAEETIKIFSPLASKAGDARMRSELDELSFKCLEI